MALGDVLGNIETVINTASSQYLKIQEAMKQGRDPREALKTEQLLAQADVDRQKSRMTLAIIVVVILGVLVLAWRRR